MPLALPQWAARQDLMIKMLAQSTPEASIAAQSHVTAGAPRQEKVGDDSGQATERMAAG
jgi:hypothetical protein